MAPPYLSNLPLFHQGKVRDTFVIPERPELLLVVSTNRLSTHNVVHESLIPGKGCVLNALSILWTTVLDFWDTPHHIHAHGENIYNHLPEQTYSKDLHLRAVVVKKLSMEPTELIWRDYLTGSLWKAYQDGNDPYGLNLPRGLKFMSPFPNSPVFTPTEKSVTDDPLNHEKIREAFPEEVAATKQLFLAGRDHALGCGLRLIDAKFEVGRDKNGILHIADEWLTSDSSRYVRVTEVVEGQNAPWFDKQIFRDKAEKIWGSGQKVPLVFPPDIINKGIRAHEELFWLLTGRQMSLQEFQKKHLVNQKIH
ncbi:hypothetical protein IID27_01565 [Patescibacteria group bacterium]|nr:hypothetical protein [Patescibacteria group bacterium]